MIINRIIKDPVKAFYYFLSKINKNYLFKRYSKLSKNSGINKLYFILSFDCDTHEDAEFALRVQKRLSEMGITPVYAVPGQMLEKNPKIYKKLSNLGSEFMNHGYYEHTYFDEEVGDYRSNFFYNELTFSKIEEDIRLGDNAVTNVIGKKALGYRAPHFGVFQKEKELEFIHKTLKSINYKYSSSTIPYHSFKNGAIFDNYGLIEFPVTGTIENPMAILDTWAYFKAPGKTKSESDYKKDIISLINYYKINNINGIINIYADILHIYDSEDFFESIKILSETCENISYEKLLGEL